MTLSFTYKIQWNQKPIRTKKNCIKVVDCKIDL